MLKKNYHHLVESTKIITNQRYKNEKKSYLYLKGIKILSILYLGI